MIGRRGQSYEGHPGRGHHRFASAQHRNPRRGGRQHQVATNFALLVVDIKNLG